MDQRQHILLKITTFVNIKIPTIEICFYYNRSNMGFLGFDFTTSDFHQWSVITLVIFMIGITGLVIIMAIIMTLIRTWYSLKKEEQTYKQDYGNNSSNNIASFFKFLQRDREYEIVHIIKKGNKRIGICLEGGVDNPSTTGDTGIFVHKVKANSLADGKLFPGDRILLINDVDIQRVPVRYAVQILRETQGPVKLYVKRAQYRERRIKKAYREYKKDQTAVFTQQQIEEIEDGFSVYDRAGTGTVKRSVVMPLLRSLGYNLHEKEIWVYMNELGFTANPDIKLQDFIKLIHIIVKVHHSYEDDMELAYSVFEDSEGAYLTRSKLKQAMNRMPGRIKVKQSEVQDILRKANGDKEGNIDFHDFKKLVLPTMKMY